MNDKNRLRRSLWPVDGLLNLGFDVFDPVDFNLEVADGSLKARKVNVGVIANEVFHRVVKLLSYARRGLIAFEYGNQFSVEAGQLRLLAEKVFFPKYCHLLPPWRIV